MKQKLIAALVTSAIAGLAATTAQAGVIQATYKVYAAEIFGNSALSLKAPVVSYNLSRPVSGSSANPNTFKIALTLDGGKWDKGVIASSRAVLRDPSSTNKLPSSAEGALTNDDKTVTFTFIADQEGVTYPVNSTITFGDFSVAAPASAHASTAPAIVPPATVADTALYTINVDSVLKTPVADVTSACNPSQASISVSAKMTNASDVEVDTNDPGAIITTPVLASNVALNITAVSSSAYGPATTDNEMSKVNVLTSAVSANGLGRTFVSAKDDVTALMNVDEKTINLGKVVIKDRASLYDTDGQAKYTMAGVFGIDAVGNVSGDKLGLIVSGKFVKGSTVFLSKTASCTGGAFATATNATLNTALDTATFAGAILDADWAGTTSRSAYVCYTVPGDAVIPTTQFAVSGTLSKLGTSKEVANPICPANIYNLTSNGVQIDVRNYIPASQSTATGWADVVRFINTDETQPATITAQLIKADGSLLAAGQVLTLAPRAVKYMSNADIEAKLPATVTGAQDDNARLRITSASSSLRVQNYHVNPVTGAVTENSAAQGDDGPDHARQADAMSK